MLHSVFAWFSPPSRLSLLFLSSLAGATLICARHRPRGLIASRSKQALGLLSNVPETGNGDATAASPQVAASAAQADVLRAAWSADEELAAFAARSGEHTHKRVTYADGDLKLHGYLVWASGGELNDTSRLRPGILLVHTAVGPHDLFLFWRAEALASRGYVVLIVDMFGDARGEGWNSEWAGPRRIAFAEDPPLMAHRMLIAMKTLTDSPLVDPTRVAALGFCFGGRAVLDLLRADPEGLRAIVSFHGILNANPLSPGVERIRARALLCHAQADPFVPSEAMNACLSQLSKAGCKWDLQMFGGGVVHAFTNPAQGLNEKPQFNYDEHAARASWQAAKVFLHEALA